MREEGSAEQLAGAIYGTILSTALIAAYSEDQGSDPLQVAAAVLVTALVFWLAHAYAGVLARGSESGEGIRLVSSQLARQWPIVAGSVPPIVPLLLAPLGVCSDYTAEQIAIGTGIALLGAVGMVIAWRRGRGPLGIVIGATESALFGIIVVGLKALIH
jgi:hypothetical protein